MLTNKALANILDEFGVRSVDELITTHEVALQDSVVPAFCRQCGMYYGEAEPDMTGGICPDCKSPTADSIVEILLNEIM